jgi:hypothetical protein
MLQAGRSRVRFPMRSLDFFSIDLILPAHYGNRRNIVLMPTASLNKQSRDCDECERESSKFKLGMGNLQLRPEVNVSISSFPGQF